MKKFFLFGILFFIFSCKVNYSFTGINIGKNIKTFSVSYFPNNAALVVPGINEDFRNMLIDKITQSTNLEQVKSEGDLSFEGEIAKYDVQPVSLTAGQTAAMNRLTVKIKIIYTNRKKDEDNFTKTYSYYYDYPADKSRTEIQDDAHQTIFEHILNDVFNDTLAKW